MQLSARNNIAPQNMIIQLKKQNDMANSIPDHAKPSKTRNIPLEQVSQSAVKPPEPQPHTPEGQRRRIASSFVLTHSSAHMYRSRQDHLNKERGNAVADEKVAGAATAGGVGTRSTKVQQKSSTVGRTATQYKSQKSEFKHEKVQK